jgi:hypothetical protein
MCRRTPRRMLHKLPAGMPCFLSTQPAKLNHKVKCRTTPYSTNTAPGTAHRAPTTALHAKPRVREEGHTHCAPDCQSKDLAPLLVKQ